MRRIRIFDTTLRDGEQSPGASLNVEEKVVIARQLERLGVDIIEAGFPISSSGDFDAVRHVAESVRTPVICGLARCREQDIERAAEALRSAQRSRIHVFIATSRIHMEKKLRMPPEEVVENAGRCVAFARKYTDDVEFSPEDATRSDLDFMCRVIEVAIRAGATTVNIPDTVGYTTPEEFSRRIRHIREKVPGAADITLSAHCHNDLGLAVANSLAAVDAGCDQIECTVNGLGERAGNASLEELVMSLRMRRDIYEADTGIDTREIWATSRLVSNLTGIEVQRNKAIVGINAFAHEAGIHQHGVISDPRTYEIMSAEDVGWRGNQLVIGKHSGVHAIDEVLRQRGYNLEREQLQEIARRVKETADREKVVAEEDVVAIAGVVLDELSPEERLIELKEVSVMTGNSFTASATIRVTIEGRDVLGTGTGVGPVDAASHALQQILRSHVGPKLELKEYGLKAITGGTNALAHAHIEFSDESKNSFRGEGIDEDVILASVQAMLRGANRALNFKKLALRSANGSADAAKAEPS
ncbi:MAG: 2-isopropylmalate synthase [Planctomycetes bacterium]|nr:2-isopropylmalate synthase [Planctomycetota bacterium]